MIDGTLKLKRFADGVVASLVAADPSASDSEVARKARGSAQIELEDAVRNGFKAGMGSRQNAPAEWLGECVCTCECW